MMVFKPTLDISISESLLFPLLGMLILPTRFSLTPCRSWLKWYLLNKALCDHSIENCSGYSNIHASHHSLPPLSHLAIFSVLRKNLYTTPLTTYCPSEAWASLLDPWYNTSFNFIYFSQINKTWQHWGTRDFTLLSSPVLHACPIPLLPSPLSDKVIFLNPGNQLRMKLIGNAD